MRAIRTAAYALARKIIAVRHSLSLELVSYVFITQVAALIWSPGDQQIDQLRNKDTPE
jgi:hypothetical protein